MKSPRLLFAFAAACGTTSLFAQINLASLPSSDGGTVYTYTQDFNSLPAHTTIPGTGSVPQTGEALSLATMSNALPGWVFSLGAKTTQGSSITTDVAFSGLSSDGTQSTAANSAPTIRNYGVQNGTDRALGMYVATASAGNYGYGAIGIVFQNNTGSTLTSMTVSYRGEEWRRGPSGTLDFAYQTLASYDAANHNLRTSGTWNDVEALNFHAPLSGAGAGLDGNASTTLTSGSTAQYWNGTSYVSATTSTVVSHWTDVAPSLINFDTPVANGEYVVLRWSNYQGVAGMAIDDLSVSFTTAAAIPEPSTYAALFGALALGATMIVRRRQR